ncbi:1180_t:CDS:1, partial [Gigaspora margarita]
NEKIEIENANRQHSPEAEAFFYFINKLNQISLIKKMLTTPIQNSYMSHSYNEY